MACIGRSDVCRGWPGSSQARTSQQCGFRIAYFSRVYSAGRYVQDIALGWWGLPLALPLLWWSRGDMDMLMAGGVFASLHLLPNNLLPIVPAIARLSPRAVALACIFSWFPFLANWIGPAGWWLVDIRGLGVAVLIGMMSSWLPPSIDWHKTHRPATLALFSGKSPYGEPSFLTAPWGLISLLPFAILPERVGRAALFMASIAAFAFTAHQLGAKPLALIAFLLSPATAEMIAAVVGLRVLVTLHGWTGAL